MIGFESYVSMLLKREFSPPEGFVCDSVYWAICDDEMVGRISLRHERTAAQEEAILDNARLTPPLNPPNSRAGGGHVDGDLSF